MYPNLRRRKKRKEIKNASMPLLAGLTAPPAEPLPGELEHKKSLKKHLLENFAHTEYRVSEGGIVNLNRCAPKKK